MSTGLTTQIEIDARGVAWVAGANTKVKEIVLDKLAYGWSPEEMHFQHPHLSLAQIYGALAYYYDHQEELDGEIERRRREADEIATSMSDPHFREKLLARASEPDECTNRVDYLPF